MYILHIEHPVSDFDRWKQAFDSDPVDRAKSGVRRFRVMRALDDPNYITIDLEFDRAQQAEALLASLRRVLSWVEGTLIKAPRAQISEAVESASLQ